MRREAKKKSTTMKIIVVDRTAPGFYTGNHRAKIKSTPTGKTQFKSFTGGYVVSPN